MITCGIYQRIISSKMDTDGTLPSSTQNHLRACPACREHYEGAKRLVRQLSAGADDPGQTPSPFLHLKIMGAVRARGGMRVQQERGALGWATLAAAVCLMAAGIIWWRQSPAADSSVSTSASIVPVKGVDLPSAAQVDRWAKNIDAPLERETELVLSDANAAVNSLANNFVPEDLLKPAHE